MTRAQAREKLAGVYADARLMINDVDAIYLDGELDLTGPPAEEVYAIVRKLDDLVGLLANCHALD